MFAQKNRLASISILVVALGLGSVTTMTSVAQATQTPPIIQAGTLIAADLTISQPPLAVVPAAPGALSVTTEPGAAISVTAPGAHLYKARADKSGKATVRKLTAGKKYTIRSAGHTVTATPVNKVAAATSLQVFSTSSNDAARLTWKHQYSPKQGPVTFRITATEQVDHNGAGSLGSVQSESTATNTVLEGLNPRALYTFTVTPVNALGSGKATSATMDKSLLELNGATGPVTSETTQPDKQPETIVPAKPPVQVQTPQPVPAPQKPETRTIYVCPSGFVEKGDTCITTRAYTFHSAIENRPYTFHNEDYQVTVTDPGPVYAADLSQSQGTPCPWGGSLNREGDLCVVPGTTRIETHTRSVKDSTPVGFIDNGTEWQRSIQVKDQTPTGFTDNGTEWINSVAKVAQVVNV